MVLTKVSQGYADTMADNHGAAFMIEICEPGDGLDMEEE
jgi:hypothetical protein